jgi:hypothetical protein
MTVSLSFIVQGPEGFCAMLKYCYKYSFHCLHKSHTWHWTPFLRRIACQVSGTCVNSLFPEFLLIYLTTLSQLQRLHLQSQKEAWLLEMNLYECRRNRPCSVSRRLIILTEETTISTYLICGSEIGPWISLGEQENANHSTAKYRPSPIILHF